MIALEYQIPIAVALDLLIGDPRWWPHPVRLIAILALGVKYLTQKLLRYDLLAGIVTMLIVAGGVGTGIWAAVQYVTSTNQLAGDLLSIFIIYTCLAPRDLLKHSGRVYQALKDNDLQLARQKVAMIVGRDTDNLDEKGITRAAVESVAENLVDGVTAPLLYAVIFGPAGAITYKAINTLDSMFGYKTDQLRMFGWASARIDDLVNLIPARVTLPIIALAATLLRLHPLKAIGVAWRDHRLHSSPNAAWSEAAFAGAMNIQLGGPTQYGGIVREHPVIGDTGQELQPRHIRQANWLMVTTTLLFMAAATGGRIAYLKVAEHFLAS